MKEGIVSPEVMLLDNQESFADLVEQKPDLVEGNQPEDRADGEPEVKRLTSPE